MNKTSFDDIPIPHELDATVNRALRRGRFHRFARSTVSGMAAVLALVFFTANLPVLYAGAAELPLLGPMVRIMHMGSGGSALSGVSAVVQAGETGVRLRFDGGVPRFSAARKTEPRRLVLRLHGMAALDPEELTAALVRLEAVAEAWPVACTDPAERAVTVVTAPGWDCAVEERGEGLVFRFFPGEREEPAEGYVLAGPVLDFGPELARMTESLLWEGASQLRLPDGRFQVVLGRYADPERAERASAGILAKTGIRLHVQPMTKIGGNEP